MFPEEKLWGRVPSGSRICSEHRPWALYCLGAGGSAGNQRDSSETLTNQATVAKHCEKSAAGSEDRS